MKFFSPLSRRVVLSCALAVVGLGIHDLQALTLTNDPKETVSIQIPADAGSEMVDAANDLSIYLGEMFGKAFPVVREASGNVIILGTGKDYPEFTGELASGGDQENTEVYLIKSEPDRAWLVGRTPLAVANGSWELLHSLGYRHYFSNQRWEIVPKVEKAEIKPLKASGPAYRSRRIFIGGSTPKELKDTFALWQKHNRLPGGFDLQPGHAYQSYIRRSREVFDANPDFLAGNEGDKFNIANPDLRRFIVEKALERVRANPSIECLSMEPSDGGGWPEHSPLGSVTDQVITLANEVAVALRSEFPGKKVALYAYNEHAPLPTIPVDDDIIITVSTHFLRGHKFETLIEQWGRVSKALGVRDYLSVWPWDSDLPGKSKAANPRKVTEDLADYHRKGARYYIAETSYSFGPNGLGFYLAARTLWDPSVAGRFDEIREEFLAKSFGSAADAMRKFYDQIDGHSKPSSSSHVVGMMYRALQEAYASTADPDVLSRIDDLTCYTRFVELYRTFNNAVKGDDRERAYLELATFAKKIAGTGMIMSSKVTGAIRASDRGIKISKEEVDTLPATPLEVDEIRAFVGSGIANNKTLSFTPVAYSAELVPLEKERASAMIPSAFDIRGPITLYTSVKEAGEPIEFIFTGSKISKKERTLTIDLFANQNPLDGPVERVELLANQEPQKVRIFSRFAGVHRIEINQGMDLATLQWENNLPVNLPAGDEQSTLLHHRKHEMFFFVPKGTKVVGGYTSVTQPPIQSVDGETLFSFELFEAPNHFEISVPEGHDGQVWKMKASGLVRLMTVPPYLSPDPSLLLVPAEVGFNQSETHENP